jgi:uncharacterized protein DUF4190
MGGIPMSNIIWREPEPQAPPQPQEVPDGKAIASLVLGIVGLTVLPLIGSILAINFGRTSISNADKRGERGSAMATAGVILGWIGLAATAIFFAIWFFTS